MALTQSIVEIVEESASQHGVTRVRRITLTVGELAEVVEESLRFCFEAMTPGTIMEGAELVWESVPAASRCVMCGAEFRPDPLDFTCPECQNPFTEVVAGKEFAIASIEAEDEDGPQGDRDEKDAKDEYQGSDEGA
jgi:hydrogenase nickel incorporation protein HypA/HybF